MDTTGNPYAIYPGDEPLVIKEGLIRVERFVFENYLDAEHRCRIVDEDGRDIFNVRGSVDFSPIERSPGELNFRGLQVLEMQSGNCYIYLK